MYVCICNPFTDHDVLDHLEGLEGTTRVRDVYAACSGGEDMNCGTCACALKSLVDDHNGRIVVCQMSAQLKVSAEKIKEVA